MKKNSKTTIIIVAVAAVIAAVVTTVIVASGSDSGKYNKHIKLAQQYMEALNYEQAIAEFNEVLVIDPINAEAYLGKAKAYAGLGENLLVIETCRDALSNVTETDTPALEKLKALAETAYLEETTKLLADKNYAEALRILQEGYEMLGSDPLLAKKAEIDGILERLAREEAEAKEAEQRRLAEEQAAALEAERLAREQAEERIFWEGLRRIKICGYDILQNHIEEICDSLPLKTRPLVNGNDTDYQRVMKDSDEIMVIASFYDNNPNAWSCNFYLSKWGGDDLLLIYMLPSENEYLSFSFGSTEPSEFQNYIDFPAYTPEDCYDAMRIDDIKSGEQLDENIWKLRSPSGELYYCYDPEGTSPFRVWAECPESILRNCRKII